MILYCPCCGTNNEVYIRPNGKREKYCSECNKTYTAKERKNREFKLIFDIIKNMKG